MESTDRRQVEFMTIAVWRLFGNSMPWFIAIGLVRQWDAATKNRLRRVVYEAWDKEDTAMFGAGVKPAKLLRKAVLSRNVQNLD